MAKVVTLATNGSPSVTTWTANATSQYYVVNAKDNTRPAPCSVDASGTWSSGTVAIQQCNDVSASPQIWGQLSTLTANGVYNFTPPMGAGIRCVLTGVGSPLSSLTIKLRGDFDGQTGTPAV